MDDFVKQAPSYQLDQDILDARGINMTVEEVAGLSTCKYSQKVQALNLNNNDLFFLKCLRRRIKNRVASQNSRRRSLEHLRRLTRELRAVRACRNDALCERRTLVKTRSELRSRYATLRAYVVQILKDRSDSTNVPDIEIDSIESHTQNKTSLPMDTKIKLNIKNNMNDDFFECRLGKLVQQSVNHIYKERCNKKMVTAKTVFLDTEPNKYDISLINECFTDTSLPFPECRKYPEVDSNELRVNGLDGKIGSCEEGGVLNLSVKERRRSHGRKQLAPKRITYVFTDNDDGVIDFSIKKENQ